MEIEDSTTVQEFYYKEKLRMRKQLEGEMRLREF